MTTAQLTNPEAITVSFTTHNPSCLLYLRKVSLQAPGPACLGPPASHLPAVLLLPTGLLATCSPPEFHPEGLQLSHPTETTSPPPSPHSVRSNTTFPENCPGPSKALPKHLFSPLPCQFSFWKQCFIYKEVVSPRDTSLLGP